MKPMKSNVRVNQIVECVCQSAENLEMGLISAENANLQILDMMTKICEGGKRDYAYEMLNKYKEALAVTHEVENYVNGIMQLSQVFHENLER